MLGRERTTGRRLVVLRRSDPLIPGSTAMKGNILSTMVLATLVAIPLAANAQSGAATGAATGAVTGGAVGGPAGAAVGAGVGAVAGGISEANRPKFRQYVTTQKRPSYTYKE